MMDGLRFTLRRWPTWVWLITSSAAGLLRAQVVGYTAVTLQPGWQLVANPFQAQDNRIPALFQGLPAGTLVSAFTNGTLTTNAFGGGAWTDSQQSLVPGAGAFVFNPASTNLTVIFSGTLLQGTLTNPVPAGLSLRSRLVPLPGSSLQGRVTSDLGLPAGVWDNVYRWDRDHFVTYTRLPGGGWFPDEPVIHEGESFFVNANHATNWLVTYTP